MDKISGILSPRGSKRVDVSHERPVRAGAPSYGQPVSLSSKELALKAREEELQAKALEARLRQRNYMLGVDPDALEVQDKVSLNVKSKPSQEIFSLRNQNDNQKEIRTQSLLRPQYQKTLDLRNLEAQEGSALFAKEEDVLSSAQGEAQETQGDSPRSVSLSIYV